MIKLLRDDTRFIVCLTDKNLGPAIIERDVYIQMAVTEHLQNGDAYRPLSPEEASTLVSKTEAELKQLITEYAHCLSKAEQTYFERSYNLGHRIPRFYLTMKVHKTPMASRPVVNCVGSFNEIFSKWLDYQMSRLLPLSKTYLRDSTQVLSEFKSLGKLPPNARLFTADAVSMYTKIDTAHAMKVFRHWFTEFSEEIPTDFPVNLFLAVLEIIMMQNVFELMTHTGFKLPEPPWEQVARACLQRFTMPSMNVSHSYHTTTPNCYSSSILLTISLESGTVMMSSDKPSSET
jgi:hypothetical protein